MRNVMQRMIGGLHGSVAVALSVASRAALFLGLSWHVYAGASAERAASFFQDLFFQSVLITFFSASSFFAVVSKGWDDSRNGLLMLTHGILGVVGTTMVVVAGSRGVFGVEPGLLLLLLAGALATGLASPLTGLIVRSRGPWRAYGPSIVLAPLFLGVILWPGLDPVYAAVVAIVGFQVAAFLYLGVVGRQVFVDMLAQVGGLLRRDAMVALAATFVFGGLNTVFVGYLYWFREAWTPLQEAELAAAVLFVFRISDTFIGIVLTDLGSRIDAIRLVETRARKMGILVLGLGTIVIAMLWTLGTLNARPFVIAVLGQVILECLRLPFLVFFLYQGARRSGIGYAAYNIGAIVVSYLLLLLWPLQAFPTGFHVFMAVITVTTAAITSLYAAIRPDSPKAKGV
jgi:hypothetical protein